MGQEFVAKGKYIKGSPRKARIPATIVKGMLAVEALDVLKYAPKKASEDVRKVVKSAIANATHNFGITPELLYIHELRVDKAPFMKRFKVKSRGAGYSKIMKYSSHITVVLKSLDDVMKENKSETQAEENVTVEKQTKAEKVKTVEVKTEKSKVKKTETKPKKAKVSKVK